MSDTAAYNHGRYIFTAEEKDLIEAAYKTATGPAQRRLEALYLHADGKSYDEIIQATGYSESSVCRILRRYREDGLAPIYNEPFTGKRKYSANHYELTPEQISELRAEFENAAKPYVAKRFRALLLRSEGKTLSEVAAATGFSENTVFQLAKRYREGGAAAIVGKSRPHTAFKHTFTQEQKYEIAEARKVVADNKIAKRLDALLLRIEGKTMGQIGSEVGFHPMTVMNLVRKYQENGLESIIGK